MPRGNAFTDERVASRRDGLPQERRRSQNLRRRRRAMHEVSMNLHLTIGPIVSLIAGILILVVPRLLNYIVAIYLIIIGLIGLFGSGNFHLQ